jgi:hypothetical protein
VPCVTAKSARPPDLPIEHPIKCETVVNLKTAKALGLVAPNSIIVSADPADEVIDYYERPTLQVALMPMTMIQHLSRDRLNMLPRLVIPGKFITIRIRDPGRQLA